MKVQIFYQNHRLTPLQKCKFFDFFKMTFLLFKKAGFLFKTLLKSIARCFLKRNRCMTVQIFDQNHGLTPLQKCKFFDF